jgi:hypothetical protein
MVSDMIDQIFKYATLLNAAVAAVMAILNLYVGDWLGVLIFALLTVLSIYNYRNVVSLIKEHKAFDARIVDLKNDYRS